MIVAPLQGVEEHMRKSSALGIVLLILSSGCTSGSGESGTNVNPNLNLAIPLAPTNFTGEGISASQNTLTWTDASDNETGFVIERKSETGADWVTLPALAANTNRFADAGLNFNTKYYYRIRAVNDSMSSDWVESGGIETLSLATSLPPTPGLTAVPNGSSSITLNFSITSDATNRQEAFFLDARKTAEPGTLLITAQKFLADDKTFAHTGLLPTTSYTYQLKACNQMGCSDPATASATTTAAQSAPPSTPTLTEARAMSTASIQLTWTMAATPSADGFIISRRLAGATTWDTREILLTETTHAAASTQYTWVDLGLIEDTEYDYKLVAKNDIGSSAESNSMSERTLADGPVPSAPINLDIANAVSTAADYSEEGCDFNYCSFDMTWGCPANYEFPCEGITFDIAGSNGPSSDLTASSRSETGVNALTFHFDIDNYCTFHHHDVWQFTITPKRNGTAGTPALIDVTALTCTKV
jgi:hypothetical protein